MYLTKDIDIDHRRGWKGNSLPSNQYLQNVIKRFLRRIQCQLMLLQLTDPVMNKQSDYQKSQLTLVESLIIISQSRLGFVKVFKPT